MSAEEESLKELLVLLKWHQIQLMLIATRESSEQEKQDQIKASLGDLEKSIQIVERLKGEEGT